MTRRVLVTSGSQKLHKTERSRCKVRSTQSSKRAKMPGRIELNTGMQRWAYVESQAKSHNGNSIKEMKNWCKRAKQVVLIGGDIEKLFYVENYFHLLKSAKKKRLNIVVQEDKHWHTLIICNKRSILYSRSHSFAGWGTRQI